MPKVTLISGSQFESAPDAPILAEASEAGVFLPYSCKTGRCSTCKTKVLLGETRALRAETGLSGQEILEGWILSCVRAASSDVVLDAEDLGVTLPPTKTFPCRIASLERVADDIIKVSLRLPPTTQFDFFPGQYIDVTLSPGVSRSYSVANAPVVGALIELHVRAVKDGVLSDYWFNRAQVNDLLRFNGPLGTFFLRGCAEKNLVFLATGTGIAPVKSILEAMPEMPAGDRPRSVTVLWGAAHARDLYFDVAGISGNHHFIPVLSRASDEWQGARGHVQQVLLRTMPALADAIVYACGSPAMINDARALLVESGLPANCFHSDAFVPSSPSNSPDQEIRS